MQAATAKSAMLASGRARIPNKAMKTPPNIVPPVNPRFPNELKRLLENSGASGAALRTRAWHRGIAAAWTKPQRTTSTTATG